MTSSTHGLYAQGYTRATMVYTKGRNLARVGQSVVVCLSPGMGLQLDSLKVESPVIACQHAAVKTCSSLVHTPRHTM